MHRIGFPLLICLFFISAGTVGQVNLNNGLVAYYPMNGSLAEVTGNGQAAESFNGVQYTTDRFGAMNGACYFDGLDDYLQIANNITVNPSESFSIALYFTTESSALQTLVGKIAYTGSVATQYQMSINFSLYPGVLFGTNPPSSNCAGVGLNAQYVNTGNPIPLNQWQCVVGTFDNGLQKIYLNGVLIESRTVTHTTMNQCANATVQVGSWWSGDPQRFRGKIDDLRFYNRALNAAEVLALCSDAPALSCNNWLRIPNYNTQDFVSIGDLDITGDKITVEACFNADTNYFIPSTISYDLVSKHTSTADCNYLLRPVTAEITTTNGFYQIIACDYKPKKINHVALVYDGSTLKFYRNGYLMGSRPASGNLLTNNLITKIGNYAAGTLNGSLKGYINEVRIWNVARSQDQISAFMNSSLPSPASQPGLVAYYVFDDLQNKQGNALWNGQLNGAATINALNPQCGFLADSCESQVQAGTCNGSLGDPVVNITFGNGNSNPGPALQTAVPGASTNYNYAGYATGNPPAVIFDGDYALVTGVPTNGAWFTGARDHTGDPGGYMAFFNAAPTPGEFYRQTVSGLCPGTTYEFAAWVANVLRASAIPSAILPNITFRLLDPANQQELASYSTGNIAMSNTMTWQQYSFLFTLPPGSSSVTLVLANNNIGGTAQPGNDLAIDDITFRPCGPLTRASFSSGTPVDTSTIQCGDINLFGTVSGGLTSPAYQWQISTDGGNLFNNISGATSLSANLNNLSTGNYIFRLLTAEAGNIGSANCRFTSNQIRLTVTGCNQVNNGISGIVNAYTPVLSADICRNILEVEDASAFNAGDTVLIIQMKGASINNTNSDAFGTVNSYNDAGLSEINYVDVINGNTVLLKNELLRNYDAVNGAVQLIRVPFYPQLSIQDTITCLPWDGRKGGVVVLNSGSSIGLSGVIDVSGKGFKGGGIGAGFNCNNTGNWAVPAGNGGTKGEGIAAYPIGQEAGGAHLASGGGGSYSANTGGGGGGNGGAGGNGGNQTNTCPAQTFSYGGEGYQYADNDRVFMGGGGGGGQQDDGQPVAPGGNGGGIVLLLGDTLTGNNGQILANGESVTTLVRDEGGAGGGAGGSVFFYVNHLNGTLSIEANGGDGSSNENQVYPGRCHGPGGGGGGGWIGTQNGPLPPGIFSSLNGGRAGRILNPGSVCFNSTHGAQDGAAGLETSGVQVRIATLPFIRNIDSVRFDTLKNGCRIYSFNGNAYTNTVPVSRWEWDFGDGNTDTVQNTTHTYLSGGTYLVKLVITDPSGCRDSFSMPVHPQGIRFDYIFEQDACSPETIHLQARGESSASLYWSIGDGTVYTNSSFPSHTYADTGTYLIRYHTGSACDDTLSKRFHLAPAATDIIATADTTLCLGTGLQLRSRIDSSLSFCWKPTSFLQNPASANPYAELPGSASYELLAQNTGSPVNQNGDFSAGFTGFGSDYTEGFTPLAPGQYMIAAGSSSAGPGAINCTDRSQPAGSMLLLLSGSTGSAVKQPVPLVPDQSYRFSMWVLPLVPGASDTISILLNGIEMARDTLTGTSACNWQPLHFNWNAGILNTAEWSVRITGNSFIALDDIRFVPLTLAKETIRITVDTAIVQAGPDVQVCPGIPVQLNATGASGYSWSPATGLSATNIANPLSNPAGSISYTVTGSSAAGCTAADTIRITLLPVPQITLTADTGICRNSSLQLQATGGISFSWQPAAAFSNPSIPNPVVNPAQNTTYYVTVTGTNTCTSTDSVKVTLLQPPVFSISNPQDVCKGIPAQLTATGGDQYTWLPAAPLNNAGIANPLAVCDSSTSFTVFIRNSRCNDTATLSTRISIRPAPVVTASKSNDISCNQGTAQLQAAGAASFSWLPVTGLSDPGLPNPVARPLVTTLYTVTGTNPDGCSATASVEVLVDQSNRPTFLLPNAFSPNGDGLNDCFGIKYFGQVLELQLLIYNRYGEPVFFTSDATACWDGTYKGKPALAGNYVYYLKAVTACGRTEKRGNLMLVR